MSFRGLCNQTMTVQRPTVSQDDIGAPTRTWTNRYSGKKCRLEQLTDTERLVAGREGVEATHRLYYLPDLTIAEKDRVRIDSTKYEIESVVEARAMSKVHHYEALVVLRK